MIKKIILAAIILVSSYNSFSQFTITGPADVTEGFTVDYTVNYTVHPPTGANYTITVINGTLLPTGQLPPYQTIRVKWDCLVADGSITLTESGTPNSFTYNTTVLSYLSSTNYCNIAYPEKQNNNYGQWPDFLDVIYCSPYCISSYTFQWQIGDVPIGVFPQVPTSWADIPGAAAQTYQPPIYNSDCIKAYRRKTTYSDVLGLPVTKISSIAVISTFDFLDPGTITWTNVFNNGVPIITQTPATGGLCDGYNYVYTWERSLDGVTYSSIGMGVNYPSGVQIPGSCFIRRRVDCGGQTLYTTALPIIVQPLLPGAISGSGTYAFNTIPPVTQTPASGGACSNPDYVYTWERSINNGPWLTFGPAGTNNPNYPANAGVIATCQVRRKVHCVYEDAYTLPITFTMSPYTFPNTENLNYVRVNDMVIPAVHSWEQADALPTGDKLQTTNYLDGFGRTIQTVVKQGSLKQTTTNLDPDNLNNYQDLVSHIQYDGLGRADKGFLSYATTTNLGFYKTNVVAEQQSFTNLKYGEPIGSIYTYSQTTFDGSPLNRVINQKLPGYYWNSNSAYKGISSDYGFNKQIENIRIWDIGFTPDAVPTSPGAYGDNLLTKNITKDETDKLIVTYTDLSGNTILKRVQEASTVSDNSYTGWLNTYYVYDDFGKLRYTITPKAVADMALANTWVIDYINTNNTKKGLCFYQEYDKRGRVIVKHSPDGGEVWLVYDKRDRLVLSQDENQRNRVSPQSKQWSFSLYDDNDRPLVTGLIDDNLSNRIDMQNYVDGLTQQNQQVSIYTGSSWETITAYNPVAGKKLTAGYYCQNCTESYTNSVNYYDEYNSSGNQQFITLSANDFAPTTNQYVEQPVKSLRTKGMVTGSKIRVLDDKYDNGILTDDKFLSSTSYIDDRGRIIQTHAENIFNTLGVTGSDVASVQYDFAGKVLCTKGKHNAPSNPLGNPFDGLLIVTKNDYDLMGRVKKLWKLYTKTSSDISNLNKYKKLSELAVDEFGRAKTKQMGDDPANPGNPLDKQDFTYNIQGNLTGINKDYALGTGSAGPQFDDKHFGMYLGYENGDGKFIAPQWNGNLTGVIWRSQGDNTPRKYNYEYDNINRFKAANYLQKEKPTDPDNTWSISKVDLSAFVTYKDANGNIGTMKQTGIIPGTNGGVLIDDLTYEYYDKSNKLKKVDDQAFGGSNVQNGKQGDFKKFGFGSTSEYEYDKNGNLKIDKNKNIIDNSVDGIISNFLDLPHQIIIKDKSKTEYTYDAAGNKLSKKVTQLIPSPPLPKTTYYVGGFVYETSATAGQPDELQYILNEEGKLRIMEPHTGPVGYVNDLDNWGNIELDNATNKWGVWDYFIKDNLSNTRMVLTEEYHVQKMLCTMERTPTALEDEEEATFGNTTSNEVENTRISTGSLPWQPSPYVSKLIFVAPGVTPPTTIGPNAILKVMAGDKLTGTAKYYYQSTVPSNNTNSAIISNIANSLFGFLQNPGTVSGVIKDNITYPFLSSGGGPLQPFLSNYNPPPINSNTPKAFINYIFFDEQFRYVAECSGAMPVPPLAIGQTSSSGDMPPFYSKATKNGYVYIYLSNESSNIPVYFDDFSINHTRAPIVEDNAYYPFGLKIQGISARAAGKLKTKQGYQGDYSEQDDETGYNEFALRSYDPQIGRWIQVDPFVVQSGMYNGMGNDPVNMVDPTGGEPDPDWYENLETGEFEWFDGNGEIAGYKHRGVDFVTETNIKGVYAYYGFSADQEWQTKYLSGVTVGGDKVDNSLMGRAYPQFKEITRSKVKLWNESQWEYGRRKDSGEPILQGGESDYYKDNVNHMQRYYQANKDWKTMSLVAISPLAIWGAAEAGAASLVYNTGRYLVNQYGRRLVINYGINTLQNRGNTDFSDVFVNTLNPFAKFGIRGQFMTQFVNANFDYKINSGFQMYLFGNKSGTLAATDLIFGTLGIGVKGTADVFNGTNVSRDYFVDIITGNAKTSAKEYLGRIGF